MKYAALQVRTTYSTGRAIGSCEEVFRRAEEIGLHTVGIADLQTISGVLDFYQTGRKSKVPFTIGTSIRYFDDVESSKSFFITLIASSQRGYQNLCRLISLSHDSVRRDDAGPRVSIEDIAERREDLYCLVGDLEGPYLWKSQAHSMQRLHNLKRVFGDRLYASIFVHTQYDGETEVIQLQNKHLLLACQQLSIAPILGIDAYMERADQKVLQDIVITNTYNGQAMRDPRWIMSSEEIERQVANFHPYLDRPSLLSLAANSITLAEACNKISLSFKPQIVNYPHLMHPLNTENLSKIQLALKIVAANGRVDLTNQTYRERLLYELKAITQNGKIDLIDYFLVLEDLCRWCRENGIVVGPGRGSGAGSLLNFGLRITHLDPIRYGLLFERFISEGRIQKGTLPDVDIDFSDQDAVRKYLIDKYGEDRVKSIGVMQTLRVKNAVKDAFKALHPEVEFFIVNNATKNMPKQEQEESELEYFERSLQEVADFKNLLVQFPDVLEATKKLVGYNRQAGVHPCGMAITQDPLEEFAPMRFLKDKWVLEYGADDAAFSGIIKYDILSVKTLQYFDLCFKIIKSTRGIDIDFEKIPLDDYQTFKAFERGDTESVFQFNSDVAKSILTRINVNSVDDLSLVTSVGRPGPMANAQHVEFIRRKNGDVPPTPPHHSLKEVLKDSYGIMIYQEGVMKASQILGGFSLAEADDIRKAMGKKDAKYIKPYKDRFVANASKYWSEGPEFKKLQAELDPHSFDVAIDQLADEGFYTDISPQRAEEIWHLMETFSGYGFNKSHSMSYALIGYFCQYMKVHYPIEWWMACLTHAGESHMAPYYEASKQFILLPDVNDSSTSFDINNGKIQMPFTVIKGVGDTACAEIVKVRPFASLEDFFNRVNKTKVNKKVALQLIFAGCFDKLHPDKTRSDLVNMYYCLRKEDVPEELQGLTKARLAEFENKSLDFIVPDYHQIYPEYFSAAQGVVDLRTISPKDADRLVVLGGKIEKVEHKDFKNKKTGEPGRFYKLTLSNAGLQFQCTMWSDEWAMYGKKAIEGDIALVSGKLSFYKSTPQLSVNRFHNISKDGR